MIRHTIAIALCGMPLMLMSALPSHAVKGPDPIAAAVADPARPEADRQRDASRKPAETLEFAGLNPGDQDAALLPGGG